MDKFEEKLLNSISHGFVETDSDEFVSRLHGRIEESKQNRMTGLATILMLLVVGLLTYTQFGAPMPSAAYLAEWEEESSEIFETDLWTLNTETYEADSTYTEDLALFLLEEGDLWETIDLFNEIELGKETAL